LITNWNHDQYDYAEGGGVMKNTTTVAYETVKYYAGNIGDSRPDVNVEGFADPNYYDQGPSPLYSPGGTSQVTGQGGQLQVGQGERQDLAARTTVNPVGGIQTANIQNQLRNPQQQQFVEPNAQANRVNTLRNNLPGQARSQPNQSGTGINFPTPPKQFNPVTGELGPGPGSDLPISA
jgi:hypothetical protein